MTISTNAPVNGSTNDGIGGSGTGVITSYTAAQLGAMESAGTLTPYATYVASDIGEEFYAPAADLLVPSYARVRCSLPGFGGTWDGSTDDTAAIQAANDYAATFDPPRAIELPPLVCIKNSVFITTGVYVYGHDYSAGKWLTEIRIHASFSYSTGYMLNFNTLDGTTPDAAITKGAAFQNGLFGVFISNWSTNYDNVRGAVFAGTFIALDIRQTRLNQFIKKVDNQYVDNIEIGRLFSWISHDQSEYMIDIGSGGGDALHIYNCNFPAEDPPEPAIKLVEKGGVRLSDVINGILYLERCSPALIENYHTESGGIINKGSDLTINSCLFEAENGVTGYPVTCETPTITQSQYYVNISNCAFIYGDTVHRNAWSADVNVLSQYKLTLDNSYREVRITGARTWQGVRVHENGVAVTAWNNNSFYLSKKGAYINPFAEGTYTTKLGASVNGISFTSVVTDALSSFTPGTYYYTAQVIIDITNSVGKNQTSSEKTAVVGSGQIVALSTALDTDSTSSRILRVYRGTSSGSYDNAANIPLISSINIIDEGDYISGIAWVPRGAGAVDAITTTTTGNYTITPLTGAKLIT